MQLHHEILCCVDTFVCETYISCELFKRGSMNKRGAKGSGAAALVAIIAGLLLLYILFIPESYRNEILSGDGSGLGGQTGGISGGTKVILLQETPRKLTEQRDQPIQHNLPSIHLRADFVGQEIVKVNKVHPEQGAFAGRPDNFGFRIENPEGVKNVLLSFTKTAGRGNIRILVNHEAVFEGKIDQPTMTPITIPTGLLSRENTIEFVVDGPGILFWRTNYYDLENVRVTANVREELLREASTSFILTDSDLQSIEKGSLRFLPDCLQAEVGRITVTMNGGVLVDVLPVCGDLYRKEFFPDRLIAGENELTFQVDKGVYLVDNIVIMLETKEPQFKTYYFEMDDKQMRDLSRLDVEALLKLEFASPEFKNLKAYVNGHTVFADVEGRSFSENVERFLKLGTNAVQLVPSGQDVDVVRLDLRIEETN